MAGTFTLLILSLRAPIPSSTPTCSSTSVFLIHSEVAASLGFHGRARSVQGLWDRLTPVLLTCLGRPLHRDWSLGGDATQAGLLSNLLIWRSRARICGGGDVELLFQGVAFELIYLTQTPVYFIFSRSYKSGYLFQPFQFWVDLTFTCACSVQGCQQIPELSLEEK